MKKRMLLIAVAVVCQLVMMGQAKKPTLMVMPSDAWCKKNGFMQEYNGQGGKEMIPDYKAAVSSSQQLNAAISKISGLMADRGFPLKDLSQSLKSIDRVSSRELLVTSRQSGADIAESPADRLIRIAKADIILWIDWMENTIGPKHSITYNLMAKDAYSDKTVASTEGTGRPSFSTTIPVLLEEAIQDHMDMFATRLQTHFDDLQKNGREVVLDMRVFEGCDVDFEKEYDTIRFN